MTESRTCTPHSHDMRPLPGLSVHVCRRCGFYVPLEEDDGPTVQGACNVLVIAAVSLVVIGVLILNRFF